jgi:hypothetical protein
MLDGFLASGLKATVRFVFWPLITLWLPVRWVLERYRKRLQEQMLVEGDLSTQKPFAEAGNGPRRGYAPSRLTMMAFIARILVLTTSILMVLCEAIVRGSALQDAELTGPTRAVPSLYNSRIPSTGRSSLDNASEFFSFLIF